MWHHGAVIDEDQNEGSTEHKQRLDSIRFYLNEGEPPRKNEWETGSQKASWIKNHPELGYLEILS